VGVVCLGLLLRAAAPTVVDLEGHSRAAAAALTPAQTFGLCCAALASASYSLLGVLYERTARLAGAGLSHAKVSAACCSSGAPMRPAGAPSQQQPAAAAAALPRPALFSSSCRRAVRLAGGADAARLLRAQMALQTSVIGLAVVSGYQLLYTWPRWE
jgi:hypothetical protein